MTVVSLSESGAISDTGANEHPPPTPKPDPAPSFQQTVELGGKGITRVHRAEDGHTERSPCAQLHGTIPVRHRQDRHRVGGAFDTVWSVLAT
jgi:hypothetical protein